MPSAKRIKKKAITEMRCYPGTTISIHQSYETIREERALLKKAIQTISSIIQDAIKSPDKDKEKRAFVRELKKGVEEAQDKLRNLEKATQIAFFREYRLAIKRRRQRQAVIRAELVSGSFFRRRKGRRVGDVQHYRNFFNWNNPALNRACWAVRKENKGGST